MQRPDCRLPCRLKAALARRTGRSEEELCFEERRRSARVAEEENLSLEESGVVLERGNRRARKEEPKLSDVRLPSGDFFDLSVENESFLCLHVVLSPTEREPHYRQHSRA